MVVFKHNYKKMEVCSFHTSIYACIKRFKLGFIDVLKSVLINLHKKNIVKVGPTIHLV